MNLPIVSSYFHFRVACISPNIKLVTFHKNCKIRQTRHKCKTPAYEDISCHRLGLHCGERIRFQSSARQNVSMLFVMLLLLL